MNNNSVTNENCNELSIKYGSEKFRLKINIFHVQKVYGRAGEWSRKYCYYVHWL